MAASGVASLAVAVELARFSMSASTNSRKGGKENEPCPAVQFYIFCLFSHSGKNRSANERLLRSPKDSLFSEDSSSNVEDSNNNVDRAATEPPKRGTTPIPLLLE